MEEVKGMEDLFLIHSTNGGVPSTALSIPCSEIADLFSASTPAGQYYSMYAWNSRNNTSFERGIYELLKKHSGGKLEIRSYERHISSPFRKVEYTQKSTTTTNSTAQKEGKSMSVQNIAKEALVRGGEKALVNQGAETFLRTFEKILGNELASQVLSSEQGRNLVKALGATLYLFAAQSTDKIPMSEGIEKLCSILIEVSSQSFVETNAAALMEHLPEMISEISSLGKKMEEGQFLDLVPSFVKGEEGELVLEEVEEDAAVEAVVEEEMRFR